jgi:hypothetical protein
MSPPVARFSLPKVLPRVAYPVEPLGLMFVPRDLLPPSPEGTHDRLREQPGLLDQLDDGQANELQRVHRTEQFVLNSW